MQELAQSFRKSTDLVRIEHNDSQIPQQGHFMRNGPGDERKKHRTGGTVRDSIFPGIKLFQCEKAANIARNGIKFSLPKIENFHTFV